MLSALRAVETWLVCPCSRHASEVDEFTRDRSWVLGIANPHGYVAPSVVRIAQTVNADARDLRGALVSVSVGLGVGGVYEELVPWALGRGDPVRERLRRSLGT